jgi:ribonucleoside-diphosphate reductase beta chain
MVAEMPLFLGQKLGIHDTINVKHPYLEQLFAQLKSIDWVEDEVNLDRDRLQFETCPKHIRDIMIKNLAFQAELDSIASRSAGVLIAPFISNSELWRLDLKIAENEVLHSATYTHIIKMCLKDTNEFFDEVYKNEQILGRAEKVSEVFNEIQELGAYYTLHGFGSYREDFFEETLIKYWVAMYALERIQFMSSFAATFALAEQDWFLGIASLVQKILKDELSIHVKRAKYVVDVLKKEFSESFNNILPELKQIVDEVLETEYTWSHYLFQEGRQIVGFNENLSKQWVNYSTQEVYETLGFELPFEKITESPLPFMDKWINIDKMQTAAQETQLTNYKLNSWVDDIAEDYKFNWEK